jgi:hypothetical protein
MNSLNQHLIDYPTQRKDWNSRRTIMRRTIDHDLLKGEIVVRVHVVRWPGPLGGFSKNRIIWFFFFALVDFLCWIGVLLLLLIIKANISRKGGRDAGIPGSGILPS